MIKYKYITVLVVGMCLISVLFAYGLGYGIDEDEGAYKNENNIDDIELSDNVQIGKIDLKEVYVYDVANHNINKTYDELDEYFRKTFAECENIKVIDYEAIPVGNGLLSQINNGNESTDGVYLRVPSDGAIDLFLATYNEKKLMYGGEKIEKSDIRYDENIKKCIRIAKELDENISENYTVDELYDFKVDSADMSMFYYYRVHLNRKIDGIEATNTKIINNEKTDGEKLDIDFNDKYIFGFQLSGYCNIQKSTKINIDSNIENEAIDCFKTWVYANDAQDEYIKYYIKSCDIKYNLRELEDGREIYDPVIIFNVDVEHKNYTENIDYTYSLSDKEIIDFWN